jgi:hypothetical protein
VMGNVSSFHDRASLLIRAARLCTAHRREYSAMLGVGTRSGSQV